METTDSRFYVYDRKVSPLTVISAINPRYWVVDRQTGQEVDAFVSKKAATDTAAQLNREANVPHRHYVNRARGYSPPLLAVLEPSDKGTTRRIDPCGVSGCRYETGGNA